MSTNTQMAMYHTRNINHTTKINSQSQMSQRKFFETYQRSASGWQRRETLIPVWGRSAPGCGTASCCRACPCAWGCRRTGCNVSSLPVGCPASARNPRISSGWHTPFLVCTWDCFKNNIGSPHSFPWCCAQNTRWKWAHYTFAPTLCQFRDGLKGIFLDDFGFTAQPSFNMANRKRRIVIFAVLFE